MFKLRNLLVLGIALVMLAAFMIPLTSAQPAQQATDTPGATTAATATSEVTATTEATATTEVTATAAPTTTTAISTPSTLPSTGGSDGSSAILGLIMVAVGVLLIAGAVGLILSRRTS